MNNHKKRRKRKHKMSSQELDLGELELGNGYGYFCDIHDIELHKNTNYNHIDMANCKYLEEMEDAIPTAEITDSVCPCSWIVSIVIIICFAFI